MLGLGLGLVQQAVSQGMGGGALGTLGVNPPSITENSAPGAIVGAITGGKPGSTITITDTAGSRFAISGSNVVAGATNTDYETATSYNITLRETNASYPNSPKDTVITIQVADVNTLLSALTLSAASLQENSAAGTVVGTIQNTSGGTVTITDTASGRFALGTGGDAGKVVAGATGTDYETATTHNITLTETLGESSNSPRNTVLAITITDQAVEGPTYADFVTYVNANSAGGVLGWTSFIGTNGTYRTTAAALGGSMNGSSWGQSFLSATPCRLTQHGLPSQAEHNSQISNGGLILFRVINGFSDTASLNRNGYTSGGEDGTGKGCDLLEYWDFATSQAKRMNPNATTGPTVFTLPGF